MSDESKTPEPRLLDHDADGIQELDNLLPRWWVWLLLVWWHSAANVSNGYRGALLTDPWRGATSGRNVQVREPQVYDSPLPYLRFGSRNPVEYPEIAV